jgi:hypothetical protein
MYSSRVSEQLKVHYSGTRFLGVAEKRWKIHTGWLSAGELYSYDRPGLLAAGEQVLLG